MKANSPLPPMLLLEDAVDLAEFFEATGRTIPREKWADECAARIAADEISSMEESLL